MVSPSNNDLGQQMPAFEVDARLSAVPDTTAFFIYFFSSLEGWYDRHVASSAQGFDVRKIFW